MESDPTQKRVGSAALPSLLTLMNPIMNEIGSDGGGQGLRGKETYFKNLPLLSAPPASFPCPIPLRCVVT